MNPNQDAENDRAVMTLVRSQGTEFKVSMQQRDLLTEVLGGKTNPRLAMACVFMLMHKPSPPDFSVISVAAVRNYLDGVDQRFASGGDTCHDIFIVYAPTLKVSTLRLSQMKVSSSKTKTVIFS